MALKESGTSSVNDIHNTSREDQSEKSRILRGMKVRVHRCKSDACA